MRLFTIVLLLLTQTLPVSLAIQIGRGLHKPIDSASSISSLRYRHTGYIDQKVRNMAYTSLNHEKYYMRKAAAVPVPAWNESMGPSNISSDQIEVDKSFHLPDGLPTDASTNTSSSSSNARLSNIPALTQVKEALAGTPDTDTAWDTLTDTACATALTYINGVASNPSGIAACYNTRKYDNNSGVFLADLRLFRIAAPTAEWRQLAVSSQKLEVSYNNASIMSRQRAHKRDLTRSSLLDLTMDAKDAYLRRNLKDAGEKTGKASTTLSLPPVQVEEAKDLYLRRGTGTPPQMLQALAFAVKAGGNISTLDLNEYVVNDTLTLTVKLINLSRTTVHSIFLPNITFSGVASDGTSLSTHISTNDASFVNGLFTQYGMWNKTEETIEADARHLLAYGNTFAVFPVGLVITSIWTILILMVMGYGTMSKIQARDHYRRRVRSRMSGGMGRLYTSSELENLSKSIQPWM